MREQIRKIQEEKRLALKNSEKQRNEVFQALKKQTQLVDNLKKQKVCRFFFKIFFYSYQLIIQISGLFRSKFRNKIY